MLSSDDLNSFQNTNPKRFSLKNFQLCPPLQKELKVIAIRRISGDLLKSLLSIKQSEFIEARNRVDVPHGLFGLNLDNFYRRRKENTVYIDVLELVCKEALERAKFCIVLEDLQDYVSRLFLGYHSKQMAHIFKDISDSQKLLAINETIIADFKKNSETLQKLRDKLNAFNVRESNAIAYINTQVYDVQNNCVEAELVVDPIEFRYKLDFHNRNDDQLKLRLILVENALHDTLNHIEISRHRENIVSDCIRMKQRMDIDMLKIRLEEMTQQYERDYEALDGHISYKVNGMDAMRSQYNDCLMKLDFFATEMVVLKEWFVQWEIKKHEEARALISKKSKKKKGGKKKG